MPITYSDRLIKNPIKKTPRLFLIRNCFITSFIAVFYKKRTKIITKDITKDVISIVLIHHFLDFSLLISLPKAIVLTHNKSERSPRGCKLISKKYK